MIQSCDQKTSPIRWIQTRTVSDVVSWSISDRICMFLLLWSALYVSSLLFVNKCPVEVCMSWTHPNILLQQFEQEFSKVSKIFTDADSKTLLINIWNRQQVCLAFYLNAKNDLQRPFDGKQIGFWFPLTRMKFSCCQQGDGNKVRMWMWLKHI